MSLPINPDYWQLDDPYHTPYACYGSYEGFYGGYPISARRSERSLKGLAQAKCHYCGRYYFRPEDLASVCAGCGAPFTKESLKFT